MVQPVAEPAGREQPDVAGEQPRDDEGDDGSVEEMAQRPHGRAHRRGADDADAHLEGQDRVDLRRFGHEPFAVRRDAEGRELVLEHVADLVGRDAQLELVAGQAGDLAEIRSGIGVLDHEVEQPGELDDLPVGATDEVRRLREPRALHPAEELDPGSAAQRGCVEGGHGRERTKGGPEGPPVFRARGRAG